MTMTRQQLREMAQPLRPAHAALSSTTSLALVTERTHELMRAGVLYGSAAYRARVEHGLTPAPMYNRDNAHCVICAKGGGGS
jgi:hypothetical protein